MVEVAYLSYMKGFSSDTSGGKRAIQGGGVQEKWFLQSPIAHLRRVSAKIWRRCCFSMTRRFVRLLSGGWRKFTRMLIMPAFVGEMVPSGEHWTSEVHWKVLVKGG